MTLPPPRECEILHFTHLRNLPTTITSGYLIADSEVDTRLQCEVGDRGIKAARRELVARAAPVVIPATTCRSTSHLDLRLMRQP